MSSRLKKIYDEEIKISLQEKMKYKSSMEVPVIQKITINVGLGQAVKDKKVIDHAVGDIEKISGQKPVITKAKKSIAAFKLRKGMSIGCKVTLRKTIMYEFLDRLINVALPRVRDFKGLNSGQFDGKGNFSLGIKEQIIFPEIDYNSIEKIRGMNVVIVTSAKNDKESKLLLKSFNLPFYN
jgi:large subunit ribosomal protein L5